MEFGAPGHAFDTSDVDAELARAAHCEHTCRSLIEMRNRAYRRGYQAALTDAEHRG